MEFIAILDAIPFCNLSNLFFNLYTVSFTNDRKLNNSYHYYHTIFWNCEILFCKYLITLCKFCVTVRHHLKIASDYSNMFEKRCLCGYLTRMKSLSSKYIINFGNLYSLCNLIRLLVCRHQEISTVHIKDAITLIYVLQNNILYSRQTSILILKAEN